MPVRNRISYYNADHSLTRETLAEITRERKASLKEKEEKEKARKPLPSFAEMQAQNIRLAKALQRKYPDLSLETVSNIIIYAKELPKDRGSNIIDDCIFMAQMGQHFDITNIPVLERMYKAVARMHDKEKDIIITLQLYVELICIFLTSNKIAKIHFVFSVNDQNNKGYLNKNTIRDLVKPMLANIPFVDDEDEEVEDLTFIVNTLYAALDENNDELIELEEFEHLVLRVPHMLHFMGLCFPDEDKLEEFKGKIIGRSSLEVSGYFRNERRRSLRNPLESKLDSSIYDELYGLKLELP